MDSARRLYVYTLSGISLFLLTWAGSNLLGLLLDTVYWHLSGATLLHTPDSGDGIRQQASVYGSIALVTLPAWGIHWWQAQRALTRSDGMSDRSEQRATLRALYRAGVVAAAIIAIAISGSDLVQRALAELVLAADAHTGGNAPRSMAILAVATAVGLYHARVMRIDGLTETGSDVGAAGWLARVPSLLALSIALGTLLSGTTRLLALVVERIGWSGNALSDGDIWSRATADAAGIALVGLALWLPFWLARTRWQYAPCEDQWATAEQRSALWRLWLVLATATVAAIGAMLLHLALFHGLTWLVLDQPADTESGGLAAVSTFVRSLPPLVACSYLLRWVAAARRLQTPAAEDEDTATLRAQWYGLAAVGLAMLGSGLVLLGMAVVDAGTDGDLLAGSTDWPQRALLRAGALTNVGLLLWGIAWVRAEALYGHARAGEGASHPRERRGYLLLVVGAALVVCLAAGAVLLYTLLQRLLDATPSAGSSISTSLLTLAVAVPILLLHALAWRRMPAAVDEASPLLATTNVQTVHLVLHLPPGADAADVVATMRVQLPDTARLDVDRIQRDNRDS